MDLPQPHKDLWFPDGSVVLKTESYLFRVHKSILARESTVFRDMFEFPTKGDRQDGDEKENGDEEENKEEEEESKEEEEEEYEGLPVVPIIGDNELDLIELLKMVYKPNHSVFKRSLLRTPRAVGVFRLCNKYILSGVTSAFETELKDAFPQTRVAFLKASGYGVRRALFTNKTLLPLLPMVQETGKSKTFPSLFYCCSQYSIRAILAAEELEPETSELLLVGREKVKQAIHRAFSEKAEFHHQGLDCCKRNPSCRVAACLADFDSVFQYQTDNTSCNGDDFFTIMEFEGLKTTINICDDCKKTIKLLLGTIRDQVWALLPEIFELQ